MNTKICETIRPIGNVVSRFVLFNKLSYNFNRFEYTNYSISAKMCIVLCRKLKSVD